MAVSQEAKQSKAAARHVLKFFYKQVQRGLPFGEQDSVKLTINKGKSRLTVERQYFDTSVVPPMAITEKAVVNEATGYFEVSKWQGHSLQPRRNLDRLTDSSAAYNRMIVLLTTEHLH